MRTRLVPLSTSTSFYEPVKEPLTRPRIRVLCLPDVERAIGGVKQLYRHVEHLVAIGWDAAVLTESPGFRPAWFESSAKTLAFAESHSSGELEPDRTILLVPETYIGLDLRDFHGVNLSKLSRVVFNQNAYYTYGNLGDGASGAIASFYDHPNVLQVLSVSEDTHYFLQKSLALGDSRLSRIVNAVEPIFQPHRSKSRRIHWMPRKNPEHVQAVLLGLQRCQLGSFDGWHGQPLVGLSHSAVANKLNSASIFLAFGHPEGFGLPILEAMAAGCWVVGYSGGGGTELFRYGASEIVPFGDWTRFVNAIERTISSFQNEPREMTLRIQRQALAVQNLYSADQERLSICTAWQRIESQFSYWLQQQN